MNELSENLRPDIIQDIEPKQLRLGIKSSNSNVKSSFTLLYCLWKSNECPATLKYTQEFQEDGKTKIELESNVKLNLMKFFEEQIKENDEDDFESIIKENELLKNHTEPLLVTFEEIYKIARFEFEDSGKTISSERNGGVRYNKKIIYTHNVDYIDLIIDANLEEYKRILFNWIIDKECGTEDIILESRLVKAITLISEFSIYNIKQDKNKENDILFFNEGIYERFENGTEVVDIKDNVEKRGSLRILNNILKQGLNYFLNISGDKVNLKNEGDLHELKSYRDRVKESIKQRNVSINKSVRQEVEKADNVINIDKPHNRIIFGAPGTGKSHKIDEDKKNVFDEEHYERVTFHPNYSYAQFIGAYKPIVKDKGSKTKKEEFISYEFVPGPFTRILIKSLNDENTPNLLIIEEINRANPAGVFGDVFQLLDRDSDGISKYTINISEEMEKYICGKLEKQDDIDYIKKYGLYIPKNMYIWTTMNSADQGVYPMDAAFKRRWSFEYLDIDAGEKSLESKVYNKIKLKNGTGYGEYNWNEIRKYINSLLKNSTSRINEDKLLGPFFLSEVELKLSQDEKTQEVFDNVFKSKLLMYLYEDVLKHKKSETLFSNGINSLSDLVKAYDNGKVFSFDINEFKYLDKKTSDANETVILEQENKEEVSETVSEAVMSEQESKEEALGKVSEEVASYQANSENNVTDSDEN